MTLPMRPDFTLDDFIAQMAQVRRLGPMGKIMGMVPGMREMMEQVKMNEGDLEAAWGRMRAMYDSMTVEERKRPEVVDHGRRRRIARGAGVGPEDVSKFVKDFEQSRDMMRAVGSMGVTGRLNLGEGSDGLRALGLVTENPASRDPTFVHWNVPDWKAIGWMMLGVAAAVGALTWWLHWGRPA